MQNQQGPANQIVNKIAPIYIHRSSGTSGSFIKEYYPTGKPKTMQIKTESGRIFFAPSLEFEIIN